MPLDPQVQAVLDKIRDAGNAEYWQMTPQQARDWHNRKAGILDVKPERVFKTSDRSIPGLAGAIPVRIFVPRQAAEALPELAGNRAASARLLPECRVYGHEMSSNGEILLSGTADAVALDTNTTIDVVIDWKSDVALDAGKLNAYRGQLEAYRKATGSSRALLVLMTSGKVIELGA